MNSIITLNRLAEYIARASGTKIAVAEAYLKAVMEVAKEAIANDGTLTIKGIGTFTVDSALGERKLLFNPDDELAQAVNDPFSMFQPEELAPGSTIESLDIDIIIDDIEPEAQSPKTEPEPVEEVVEEPQPEPEPVDEVVEEAQPEPESVDDAVEEPQPQPAPVVVEEPQPEPTNVAEVEEKPEPAPVVKDEPQPEPIKEAEEETKANLVSAYASPTQTEAEERYINQYSDEEYDEDDKDKFPIFWTSCGLIAGLLIGLAVGFFAHDPIMELFEPSLAETEEATEDDDTQSDAEELIDLLQSSLDESVSIDNQEVKAEVTDVVPTPAPTVAVDDDVYDVITEHVFLANLAQRHYKHKEYWVYIFLENKDVIGNPNSIKIGTRVKIPPLSKYNKHESEADNLNDARALAKEILK